MAFPYPKNPDDWQTAYTRDQAYRDSEKHDGGFIAPTIICFLFVLLYSIIRWVPISFLRTHSLIVNVVIAIIILLIFFAIFTIVVTMPAKRFASSFFTEFYRLPENIVASKIIDYRLSGIPKLPPPLNLMMQFKYILVNNGDIDKRDNWPAWSALHIGGPIMLIIFDGNALYLERGSQFSRVVGPGDKIPFLEWYETVKYVVDLRPKIRDGSIDVWTKDGINVKLKIKIECRIGDPVKNDPSASLVYPYDPVAIRKAIERYAIRWPKRQEGEPEEFTWIDAAWGQVTGIVPGYIGSRMLDDLFIANRDSGQILSHSATKEIFDKLNNATNGFGVYITDFQVLEIKPPEEVKKHQNGHWKAERQSIATIREGEAKAFNIRSQEKARAEAQRDLIIAIANGLEKNRDGHYEEALLLSLSRTLDNKLSDPLLRAYIASETLETLEKIKTMLDKPSTQG